MGQKITFISNQQTYHRDLAASMLGHGFDADALAIAAYLPGENVSELQAVAVFDQFKDGTARVQFATSRVDALSPEIVTTVAMIAKRYFSAAVLMMQVRESAVDVICAMLRTGFRVADVVPGFAVGTENAIVLSLTYAGPRVTPFRTGDGALAQD